MTEWNRRQGAKTLQRFSAKLNELMKLLRSERRATEYEHKFWKKSSSYRL